MGGLVVLAALGFAVVNPGLRTAQVEAAGRWLTGRLACVLGVTFGVALAVLGFEVAAVGTLQRLGQLEWSWVFLIVCGACSIAGGLVYGSLRRPPPAVLLAACLGVAVVPIGFADHWLWLCLFAAPANFLIAPSLAATASAVSALAPSGSKGVAMGAYASALMIGNVAGSPLAGAGLDLSGPVASFALIGCASALTAFLAFLADRRLGRLTPETPLTTPRVQP
jgi:predicted MFS family arabinose efflux permease